MTMLDLARKPTRKHLPRLRIGDCSSDGRTLFRERSSADTVLWVSRTQHTQCTVPITPARTLNQRTHLMIALTCAVIENGFLIVCNAIQYMEIMPWNTDTCIFKHLQGCELPVAHRHRSEKIRLMTSSRRTTQLSKNF